MAVTSLIFIPELTRIYCQNTCKRQLEMTERVVDKAEQPKTSIGLEQFFSIFSGCELFHTSISICLLEVHFDPTPTVTSKFNFYVDFR